MGPPLRVGPFLFTEQAFAGSRNFVAGLVNFGVLARSLSMSDIATLGAPPTSLGAAPARSIPQYRVNFPGWIRWSNRGFFLCALRCRPVVEHTFDRPPRLVDAVAAER